MFSKSLYMYLKWFERWQQLRGEPLAGQACGREGGSARWRESQGPACLAVSPLSFSLPRTLSHALPTLNGRWLRAWQQLRGEPLAGQAPRSPGGVRRPRPG